MESANELVKFEKSFRLHASRYNLYSEETKVKGAIGIHNRAVTALGKLSDKVVANPSLYEDLLFELLQDRDPKVALLAGFTCLDANLYTDKAMDTLVSIARNTKGISMICDFDIRGTISKFRKRQIESRTRNEVDSIADAMKSSNITDAEILDMILKLQDIDMCGHDERTTLIHACIFNRCSLVNKLIELGANVNKKDYSQKTALHCAAVMGSIESTTLLLNHHADVNAQDKRGFTALDFAKVNQLQLPQVQIDQLIDLLRSHGGKTNQEILNC